MQPRFVVAHDFTGAQSFENVFDRLAIVVEVDDVMTDVLIARVAEQIEFRLVGAQNRAVSAHPVQTYRRVLEEVSQLCLASFQREFVLFAFRDVALDADVAEWLAVSPADPGDTSPRG